MNVEIGAEAALVPEKEYINGIAVAVRIKNVAYKCMYKKGEKWYVLTISFTYPCRVCPNTVITPVLAAASGRMGEAVAFFFINIKHKTFSYKDGNEIIEEGGINLIFLQKVHKSKTTLLLFRKGIYLPTIPNEGKA
jgi:hypothetical protein